MTPEDDLLIKSLATLASLPDEKLRLMSESLTLFQAAAEDFVDGDLASIGHLSLFVITAAFKHPEWAAAHLARFEDVNGVILDAVEKFVEATPIGGSLT